MKEKDKIVETVVGVLALIGLFSIVLFFATLFNGNDSTNGSCETYVEEISELEEDIIDLEREISNLEDNIDDLDYEKYELEQEAESWKEEYYALEESRGCNTSGSAMLTDGSNNKGEK